MWTRLVLLCSRLGFAWARRRLDREATDEFDAHIDLLVDRYIRSGLTQAAAYVAARQQMGNVTLVREEMYEMNGFRWIDGLAQDLRYAFRQVRGNPGFAAVVIATLALGIGGTTAVFSVVQEVLIAPLPYDRPGQLVRFFQQEPDRPDTRNVLAGTHFSFLRDHATSFADVAALATYRETGLDLVTDAGAQRLHVLRVTSGYFSTLRSNLRLGRDFDRADESGARRVVLSDAAWRTHFDGDSSIVARRIRLNAEEYEVAGVAAPGFEDPLVADVDAWVPYALAKDTYEENNSLGAVGRLRDGVQLEQAQSEMATLSPAMAARWPAARQSLIVAVPLQEELVARARGPLYLLFGAVGLMLLVACVNVANLVLVRATGRVHEFAIRAALGSGRRRLIRQLLVESLLLSGLGGLVGLALAGFGIRALQRLGRDAVPRLEHVSLDVSVLAFAALVAVTTAVAFGIAPALRLAHVAPSDALRQHTRSSTGTRAQGRLRNGLAAAQLAVALVLLAGAGVLLTSFYRLQRVELGVRLEPVLTFEVNLPTVRYNAARRTIFQEELARAMQSIPGVTAAGGISRLPATGSYHPWNTRILTGPLAGQSVRQPAATGLHLQQRVVSGDVFGALGIPLLAGRTFTAADDSAAPLHAIVSANFARQGFPGVPFDDVVGQRIATNGELTIVGVVGDVALDVYGAATMAVYRPHRQFAENRNWALTQVVATVPPVDRMLAAVRAEVARMDPELVVHRPAALTDVVGRGASRERFALVLMGAFAVVSLLLAAVGLYGVLAYSVRQRRPEIGIRMALGATGAQVRGLVLRQAAIVIAIGLGAGIGGALLLGRWLSMLVFQVSPSDPRILLATAVLLAITGLAAAWLPARRASRVTPKDAMLEAAH